MFSVKLSLSLLELCEIRGFHDGSGDDDVAFGEG
jgi:hypothetical protein